MNMFCEILNSNYLQQLKKENSDRVKPSKALLDALKHSTNLTKCLKSEKQSLKSQNQRILEENELLRQMLQRIEQENKQYRSLKQQRFRTICENESKLTVQIQLLKNQNILLKRQIHQLRSKQQKFEQLEEHLGQEGINRIMQEEIRKSSFSEINSQINIETQGSQYRNSAPNGQELFNTNLKTNSDELKEELFQSARFNEYVNFQNKQGKVQTGTFPNKRQSKKEQQTRPSSNLVIQIPPVNLVSNNKNHTKVPLNSDQFRNMLCLQNSKDTLSQKNLQQLQKESLILIKKESKKLSITEKGVNHQVNNPHQSHTSSNESGFSIFAHGAVNQQPNIIRRSPAQEYTFLNIETKKSIDHQCEQEQNDQQSQISQYNYRRDEIQESEQYPQIKPTDSDICILTAKEKPHSKVEGKKDGQLLRIDKQELQNLSNCDYNGLLQDIYEGQDSLETDQQEQQHIPKNLTDVISKRTKSEFIDPEQVQKAVRALKRPPTIKLQQKISLQQNCEKNQNLNNKKSNNRIQFTPKSPLPENKYINETQSFKTIVAISSHDSSKNFMNSDRKNQGQDNQKKLNEQSISYQRKTKDAKKSESISTIVLEEEDHKQMKTSNTHKKLKINQDVKETPSPKITLNKKTIHRSGNQNDCKSQQQNLQDNSDANSNGLFQSCITAGVKKSQRVYRDKHSNNSNGVDDNSLISNASCLNNTSRLMNNSSRTMSPNLMKFSNYRKNTNNNRQNGQQGQTESNITNDGKNNSDGFNYGRKVEKHQINMSGSISPTSRKRITPTLSNALTKSQNPNSTGGSYTQMHRLKKQLQSDPANNESPKSNNKLIITKMNNSSIRNTLPSNRRNNQTNNNGIQLMSEGDQDLRTISENASSYM